MDLIVLRRFLHRARPVLPLLAACAICAPGRVGASSAHRVSQVQQVDPARAPAIPLKNLHTGERLELRLFDARGELRTHALTQLREFLRCVRTGEDHPIHWRLTTLLVALAAHFPGKTFTVVSGYRDPSVNRSGHRSNHTRGRAIDLRIDGVPNRVLRDTIQLSFDGVGVGYYPNSSFVHIDIRPRAAEWIDFSGPGQRACYSTTVTDDLASGEAERLSYEQARARGCK